MGRRPVGSKGARIAYSGGSSRPRSKGRVVGTKGARPISQPIGEKRGPNGCTGKNGTCKAYPVGETDLCIGHTRQKEAEEIEVA